MAQLDLAHERLVRRIALRVKMHVGPHADLDDLVAHGMVGLLGAERRFDPDRETSFKTFAGRRIRGAMYDALPAMGRIPRAGDLDEVADGLGCDAADAETVTIARDQLLRVRRAMSCLPVIQRRLLSRMYFEGKDLTRAAAELGLSKSWASRAHARALARLRRVLH